MAFRPTRWRHPLHSVLVLLPLLATGLPSAPAGAAVSAAATTEAPPTTDPKSTEAGVAAEARTLTIGLLPGESAPTVMRLNEPLRAYLEKSLGMPVKLVVGANYAATGEALRFGRLDVA